MIVKYLDRLGFLRALLVAFAIAIIAIGPFAGDHVEHSGWKILSSLVAPAFIPILVFVLLFDLVMSRVIMSSNEKKERYGTVMWTHIGLLLATILSWGAFFERLF